MRVSPSETGGRADRAKHAADFADPELDLEREQRPFAAADVAAGDRQQGEEFGERFFDDDRVPHVFAAPVLGSFVDFGDGVRPGPRPAAPGFEHGSGEWMGEKAVAEGDEVAGFEWLEVGVFTERGDECFGVVDADEIVGVGGGQQVVDRQAGVFDALELFADDGVGVDRSTEDSRREVAHVGCGVGTGAERGRRGDRDGSPEVGRRRPYRGAAEAAQQHDVGALGSVVGVELVEHDVAERVGGVVSPQVSVFSPQQEEVEHLVVGEQNVGRVGPKDVAFVDEVVGAHRGVASCFTDVHPGGSQRGADRC